MKNLLLSLLLIPIAALAQEQPQMSASDLEYTQTTVFHLMCVVQYENREGPKEKIEVYANAPVKHAMEHGYDPEPTATYLEQTLSMIRSEWDKLPAENSAKHFELCEAQFETWKEYLAPTPDPKPVIEGQTI